MLSHLLMSILSFSAIKKNHGATGQGIANEARRRRRPPHLEWNHSSRAAQLGGPSVEADARLP